MKSTIAALASLVLSLPAFAKEATATVKVKGWHCAGCAGETEAALKQVKGVKSAKADFDKHTVVVAYDDAQTGAPQIDKAIAKAGYQVEK
ncbi:MAG: heavy-metal-associated domain-containing protein [Myxococcales bacterium]